MYCLREREGKITEKFVVAKFVLEMSCFSFSSNLTQANHLMTYSYESFRYGDCGTSISGVKKPWKEFPSFPAPGKKKGKGKNKPKGFLHGSKLLLVLKICTTKYVKNWAAHGICLGISNSLSEKHLPHPASSSISIPFGQPLPADFCQDVKERDTQRSCLVLLREGVPVSENRRDSIKPDPGPAI